MVRISQCMIVKNEEKNIRRALTWAKDIAFEQIVVDTGSTDRTVEIAKEMGAQVYSFEWINDFAAAKNYAIDKATGNWIAFLDADEYLAEKDAKKLPGIIEELQDIIVEKDGHKVLIDIIRSELVNLNNDGGILNIGYQDRIFRNKKELRYKGIVHETLNVPDGFKIGVYNVENELQIFHTGYIWTWELREEKSERNGKLIEEKLKNNKDSITIMTYVDSLILAGRLKEAKEYTDKALNNKGGSFSQNDLLETYTKMLFLVIDLSSENKIYNNDEFMKYYNKAVKIDNKFPDFDMACGYWYFEQKKWEENIIYLKQSLWKAQSEKRENIHNSRIYSNLATIYSQLATSYGKMNDIRTSFYYASLALQARPYEEKVLCQLITVFFDHDGASVDEVTQYLGKIYDFNNKKDLLFLMKAAIKIENGALCRVLKEYV